VTVGEGLTRFLGAEGLAEPRLGAIVTIRRVGQRFKQKCDTKSAVYKANSSIKYRIEHAVHGVRLHRSLTKLRFATLK
jgi:hypothetical protein